MLDRAATRAAASKSSAASTTAVARSASTLSGEGDSTAVRASAVTASQLRLGAHTGLDIPAGAVARATTITGRHLGTDVLPPLDPGMINVTAPKGHGYEFLPHGQKFARPVEVLLPFDASLVPEGMTADDVYTFALTSDDGSRLRVGGRVVVDHDGLHGPDTRTGVIALAAGLHALEVEWFNKTGGAALDLQWAPLGGELQPVPAAALAH